MAAVLFEPLISNLLCTPEGQSAPQNRACENSNPVPFKTLSVFHKQLCCHLKVLFSEAC